MQKELRRQLFLLFLICTQSHSITLDHFKIVVFVFPIGSQFRQNTVCGAHGHITFRLGFLIGIFKALILRTELLHVSDLSAEFICPFNDHHVFSSSFFSCFPWYFHAINMYLCICSLILALPQPLVADLPPTLRTYRRATGNPPVIASSVAADLRFPVIPLAGAAFPFLHLFSS